MAPSGIQMNKMAAISIIGVAVTIVLIFTFYGRESTAKLLKMTAPETKSWKVKTFMDIPESAKANLDEVKVKEVKANVMVDGKEVSVFYREAGASNTKIHVLLLHGQAFTSATWAQSSMKTLQLLSKLGYRAVAIDLPGYGNSPAATVDHVRYMESVISSLKLGAPVIVSPSMSGSYSLPYMFKDPDSVLTRSQGFVPVAPASTGSYTQEQYQKLKIPTMHIVGEKDVTIGRAAMRSLRYLPNYENFELPEARHPAYLDQPELFHKYLYNFLRAVET